MTGSAGLGGAGARTSTPGRSAAKTGIGEQRAATVAPRYRLVRSATPADAAALTLDPAQAAVVAHVDAPLLVIGGPGTGKTTTLVEAVAARVAAGATAEQLLVLTFGRRSAASLRDRIEARLAALPGLRATMAEPVVRTFPAYAFGLLRLAAARTGEPAPRLLTGAEQDTVIRELLSAPEAADRWPKELRQAVGTRAFAGQLRDLLLRAAERGIGARRLAELGRANSRPDWVAAADFLAEYVRVLSLRDATSMGAVAYDQAELLTTAAAVLAEDPGLLAAQRARARYVYVDELADTDPAQLELLRLIAAGGGHLVAFADPDSSTFAFRGADPTGVREFTSRFTTVAGAPAAQATLTRCYRSGPQLLAATRRVAARLRGPAQHRRLMVADAVGGAGPEAGAGVDGARARPLEVCTLRSSTSEVAYVANWLRAAHLLDGVPWSRMAVIVRSLPQHEAGLRRALAQAGVPARSSPDDTALASQPAIAPFLLLLRCAVGLTQLDEEVAIKLLHSPLGGADPLAERRLRQGLKSIAQSMESIDASDPPGPGGLTGMGRSAGEPSSSGELLVEALTRPELLARADAQWSRPARAIAELLAVARQVAARPSATAEDVIWALWQRSGLAERWGALSARGGRRGASADRDLDTILVLVSTAASFTDRLPGARIESFLQHLQDQQLPVDNLAPSADRGEAVTLVTAHAAKGQQWDVVAVLGVQEGLWPDLRLRGSTLGSERLVEIIAGRAGPAGGAEAAAAVSALLDEERRLFYVAVTRARLALLVTAVDASTTGSGGDEQPSRFLAELAGAEPAELRLAEVEPASAEPAEVAARSVDEGADLAHTKGPGVGIGVLQRPMTLQALVAELRSVITDAQRSPALRAAAADSLAQLADARVAGADPDEWWGVRELSTDAPLTRPGQPVRVSPSTVESVLRCGLRWLLERNGGSAPPSAKQSIGNLVHAAAMLVDQAPRPGPDDAAALRAFVLDRFDQIELPARWLTQRERDRAEKMVDKLVTWLRANPREQLAIELEFEQSLPVADGEQPVTLRGRVDRLERDGQGRLVVVDLKTGAAAPSLVDILEHPQLAAYQVAVAAGAFPHGRRSGGAEIVAVGTTSAKPTIRVQPPVEESDDPQWAQELVRRAAEAMADSTFRAVLNETCQFCSVRTSCPLSGKGRQVTSA